MAPLPWVRIWRSSCFMQAHTPRRLIGVDAVEGLGGLVGGVAGRDLDAGVVERHVEPAEGVDGRGRPRRRRWSSSETSHGTPSTRWPAACSSSVGGMQGGLVDVGQDDRGSGFGEGAGGGQAHAGAGAGDEGDLAGEVVGRVHGGSFQ